MEMTKLKQLTATIKKVSTELTKYVHGKLYVFSGIVRWMCMCLCACIYFLGFSAIFLWKLILMLGDNITFKNSLAFLNMRDFFANW